MRNQYNPFLKILKKNLPLAVAALIISETTNAQVPPTAAGYLFTTSTGTYTPLTSGTPVTNIQADDINQPNIPIGFTFPFAGGTYTVLSAASNGWLALGPNINPGGFESRDNGTTHANLIQNMIMPLWDDLNGSPSGLAFYQTTGTAPNRVFTFEWRSWRWNWLSSNDVLSYQAKLYESGRIEFIYSQGLGAVNSGAATIGIAKSGTDYQTLTDATAAPTSSSTAFTTTINAKPATGQIYIWDKPLPNNTGVTAITEPTTAICLGTHAVKAKVKNFGGNTINNVTINWSVNGVPQPAVLYSTPIPVGGSTGEIFLGNVNFPASSATLNIDAWTSLPNGNVDPEPGNDMATISRKALDPPGAIIYYETSRVCPGDSVLLYAPTGPNFTYQWELDADAIPGATESSFYAKTDGFYSLTVKNPGCKAQSVFHKITVKPLEVELGPDLITCETNPPTLLDAGEPGARYVWSTGDTTQNIPVAEGNNKYWVEVSLGQLCKTSDTIQTSIEPLPEINGISYVNVGNVYYFAPAGPLHVNSYLWSFGDGATDTTHSPIHIYGMPGPYNVTLIVYNSCGEDTSRISDLPVKVGELASGYMSVYPNPAQDIVTIQTTDVHPITGINVFNAIGAKVMEHRVSDEKKSFTLNVQSLPPGSYSLVIETIAGTANKLFQIVR